MSNIAADPPWLARAEDYPFVSRFHEIDGSRVHYLDEGTGSTLLFLHGNPLWSFYFRKIVQALRARFRCIALDYPGYGLSCAATGYGFRVEDHARLVERFIHDLALVDITFVMHDSGGPIGLRVAGDEPGRVQALVLSDCFAWPLSEDPKVARMLRIVSGRLFAILNRSCNLLPRLVVAAGLRGASLSRSEKAAYIGPFRPKARRHVQTAMFRSYIDERGEAYMRHVKQGLSRLRETPALVLFGAGDPITKLAFHEKLATLLPRHRVILVPGQEHFPHDGASVAIARLISDWHAAEVPRRE